MGRLLAALLLVLSASVARAETMVVALSTPSIEVSANFAGTHLALFGVVERDHATVSRAGKYELVVVVEGPSETLLVQQKQRVAGIWVNAEGTVFADMPSFFAVYTTPDAGHLLTEYADERLSLASLTANIRTRADFKEAVVRVRQDDALFVEDVGAVTRLTDMFFRTLIHLPPLIDDGDYTVTTHLFADGVRLDTTEAVFTVAKVGIEQSLFWFATERPLFYGLGVVLLALVTGYVGGIVFRRN
ncbi:MAG: TIGR02186 family protein [Pseudomonadota bacterium]